MTRWDLSQLHELTLRRKPEKPILEKNKFKETSSDLRRKPEKPILEKNKFKETSSDLRRKPEKPILKNNKLKETSSDACHVLQRPSRKSTKEKPILRKQSSEKADLRKIDKILRKDDSSSSSSVQKSKKNKARKAKESFAQRRKRLRLERLKAEARSNYHREMPRPIRPFCNYSQSDNEPSVYDAVMDERRAEGMGYGGAR